MNSSGEGGYNPTKNRLLMTGEASEMSKVWEGWGTALKPAYEPIIVAVRPYEDGSIPLFHNDWPTVLYCPKPNKKEKNNGCEEFETISSEALVERKANSKGMNSPRAGAGRTSGSQNHHPTVKPVGIMKKLLSLNGISRKDFPTICDPFSGSGTTGVAAVEMDIPFIGFEINKEYVEIANARIDNAKRKK